MLEATKAVNPKVRLAISFVDDNLHRDIYIGEVAQLVRLSRTRFCHLFRAELGMSFGQFLKKARLEKGRQLLETSFEPVKAVTADIGYNDPNYFEREFKKAYGMTPSRYRATYLARIAVQKMSARETGTIL